MQLLIFASRFEINGSQNREREGEKDAGAYRGSIKFGSVLYMLECG